MNEPSQGEKKKEKPERLDTDVYFLGRGIIPLHAGEVKDGKNGIL